MAHDHAHHQTSCGGGEPPGQIDWDLRYAESDRTWSGRPNNALVVEISSEVPGRALDVGCGEGADAVWLAGEGWRVTGLDVSQVALDRAQRAAQAAGAEVRWLHAGLLAASLTPGSYDLVTAHYPALLREGGEAVRALLAAVAPGGTLLFVHHADVDHDRAKARGFDPADYVGPEDVLAALDDAWEIQVSETRPRDVSPDSAGAHHTHDVVLRACRRG